MSNPTAREREWYDYVDTADGRYVSQSEAEAEILAAERAAVEAFADRASAALARTMVDVGQSGTCRCGNALDKVLAAWLREREGEQ